jgi:uncharacterized repeat protein (TIGR01451 family)
MLNFILKSRHRRVTRSIAAAIVLCSALLTARSAQAEVPKGWTFNAAKTVATSAAMTNGTVVTATLTGLAWNSTSATMNIGTQPASFPATNGSSSLQLIIPPGCSTTVPCGSFTLGFSKPVTVPKFHISDLGGFTGSSTMTGFRFAPMTITSGQTFSAIYQDPNTQLINSNKTITLINNSQSQLNKPSDTNSCGTVFGCGSYGVNGTAPYSSLTIQIDPMQTAGTNPTLDFTFLTFDVVESATVSGKVFNDADSSKIQNGAEAGTNGGGVNAVLIDSNNLVVATTPVATTGAYSFSGVTANATYKVLITTNTATPGSAPPAVNLPSAWASTGENLNGTADSAIDSTIAVPVGTINVTGANFGIKQVPIPITCQDVYFVDPGIIVTPAVSGGIYKFDTSNGADTLVGTFPNSTTLPASATSRASGIIAIQGGSVPTAYASNDSYAATGANLQSFNGSVGTNFPNATLTDNANGLATSPGGFLTYITNTNKTGGSGTQKIYKFANNTSASVLVNAITPPPGDTIFNTLTAGDNAFDGNGRHYYFASAGGTGGTGYLYYIDSTYQAHLLGTVPTPGGATGLAFDSNGYIYTSSQGALKKVTMTNGFTISNVGTPTHTVVDLASCAFPPLNPSFDPNDGITKKVRNVSTLIAANKALTIQNAGTVGETLEYQITIKNTGTLPSDNTKFIDIIPPGTTYIPKSTFICDYLGNNCGTFVPDLTTGAIAPFTATGGMLVNTPGSPATTTPVAAAVGAAGVGIVNAGATSAVVVKFQVKITATTGAILNTGTLTYPVANGTDGSTTSKLLTSNPAVRTTLSVKVSGTVWNDLDLSGKTGTIFTTGELGTNANTTNGLYAILVDSSTPNPKVIGSTPIAANGTYNFPTVLPNQTGTKIQLSTTAGTLGSTTIPSVAIPTTWKSTAAKTITPIDIGLIDLDNKDFGIVQGANVALVKRVTGIKPVGTNTWLTTNPNDGKDLTKVVHNTPNDAATVNWPSTTYLAGAVTTVAKPGDQLEYTIYYLNTQGADVSSLKICDPIRSTQKYNPGSMKLSAGGATPIGLTDAVDAATGADRAYAYGAAALPAVVAVPTDCNLGSTLYTVAPTARDNGGLAIQLVGASATKQLDLLKIPNATPVGTPAVTPPDSYGFWRFTTTVDP